MLRSLVPYEGLDRYRGIYFATNSKGGRPLGKRSDTGMMGHLQRRTYTRSYKLPDLKVRIATDAGQVAFNRAMDNQHTNETEGRL
jgi:hypothetical protein